MPLPGEDLTTYEGWAKFVARHGGLAGEATKISPDREGGKLTGPRVEDPFYHYELADGTTVDINGAGAVKSLDEKTPRATPEQLQQVNDPRTGKPIAMIGQGVSVNLPKEADWRDNAKWMDQPDGSKRWQALNPDSGVMQDVGGVAPVPAADKSKPAPEMKQVDGVWYQRPAGSSDPKAWESAGLPSETSKAQAPTFKEFEGKLYQWQADPSKPGGGTLKLAEGIAPGAHPPGYFIEGGYRVLKAWNEGTQKYEVDPSAPPEAWSPQAKAEEAKTAALPTEGKTRSNIVGGYNVTQTYSGGDWTTTEIGARATPRDIQQLTASTETPYIVQTGEQGGLTASANPNYQGPKAPTTRGELAQRVALLQTQAAQMKDRIAADKSIPADQQSARFLSWWDQNVAPQASALEQQQQAIAQDEAQKAAEQHRQNLTSAATALQGMAPYRVGPNYGSALEKMVNASLQGSGHGNIDVTGSMTYKAPSLDQNIQDLAAQQQAPPLAGIDLQSALNRSQWMPGVPPPAGPPPDQAAAAPAGAGVGQSNSPLGAIGNNPMLAPWQAYNRQLASQQTAAATANPNNSPFGAIGPGTMPQAAPMPMASGSGPLAYNPGVFRGVMPMLPNYDYSQAQTPYQWPFGGGGGGGNVGFTP